MSALSTMKLSLGLFVGACLLPLSRASKLAETESVCSHVSHGPPFCPRRRLAIKAKTRDRTNGALAQPKNHVVRRTASKSPLRTDFSKKYPGRLSGERTLFHMNKDAIFPKTPRGRVGKPNRGKPAASGGGKGTRTGFIKYSRTRRSGTETRVRSSARNRSSSPRSRVKARNPTGPKSPRRATYPLTPRTPRPKTKADKKKEELEKLERAAIIRREKALRRHHAAQTAGQKQARNIMQKRLGKVIAKRDAKDKAVYRKIKHSKMRGVHGAHVNVPSSGTIRLTLSSSPEGFEKEFESLKNLGTVCLSLDRINRVLKKASTRKSSKFKTVSYNYCTLANRQRQSVISKIVMKFSRPNKKIVGPWGLTLEATDSSGCVYLFRRKTSKGVVGESDWKVRQHPNADLIGKSVKIRVDNLKFS